MNRVRQADLGTPASPSAEPVQVEIDGMPATVNAGTSILRAARETGVDIPKLCATDNLKPFGSCRMCLVEVEGRKGLSRVLHDAGRRRYEDSYAVGTAGEIAPQRHGTLYFGPSARLPDLFGKRRLRAPGYGRRRRTARCALRLRRGESPRRRRRRKQSLLPV